MTKKKHLMILPNISDEEILESVRRFNSFYTEETSELFNDDLDKINLNKPTSMGMFLVCYKVKLFTTRDDIPQPYRSNWS